MSQISNAHLKTILDKMARHAAESNGTPLSSAIAAAGLYAQTSPNAGLSVADTDVLSALQTLTVAFTDPDQQSDLAPPSVYIYENTPLLNQFMFAFWSVMRQALNKHMARYSVNNMITGDQSPLDAALRVINFAGITVRCHSAFQQYFGGISPNNVFTGTPLVLASITITGATAGTLSLPTNPLPTVGFCGPGQIMIQNTATEGLTSTAMTIQCAQAGGTVQTNVFTVATQTSNELTATTDTSQTYVSVPAQTPTITGGNSGDTFNVVLIPDRVIYNS